MTATRRCTFPATPVGRTEDDACADKTALLHPGARRIPYALQAREIGKLMGVEPKNVLVAKNGEVIEITKRSMRATSSVPAGDVYIDGTGIGDVGSAVLRDRRHLAEDGIVMAIITLSSENGKPVADPEIITRGFVYVKEAEALMGELKRVVNESLSSCERQKQRDWAAIKGRVKSNISGYLYKTTRRSPMVLPVIIEV